MPCGAYLATRADPFEAVWAEIEALLKECRMLEVVPFVKQLGRNPFRSGRPLELADTKGGDIDEWPEPLRIREYPKSLA